MTWTPSHISEVLFLGDRCDLPIVATGARYELAADSEDMAAAVRQLATDAEHSAHVSSRTSYDVDRIRVACSTREYLDYASLSASDVDRSLMLNYGLPDAEPQGETESGAIWLPHPAFPRAPSPLSPIAELLLLGFGRLRSARFLDLFDVPIKVPPSKGARHPFTAHLLVGPGVGVLDAGRYVYDAEMHVLWDDPGSEDRPPGAVDLMVSVEFARVHWRYREPKGYLDLWLDLGHLLETLLAASTTLDLALQHVPVAVADDRPLIRESVAAFRLLE